MHKSRDDVKFYCKPCQKQQPVVLEPMEEPGYKPWSNIVCLHCKFVIATVDADKPGNYGFVNLDEVHADCGSLEQFAPSEITRLSVKPGDILVISIPKTMTEKEADVDIQGCAGRT